MLRDEYWLIQLAKKVKREAEEGKIQLSCGEYLAAAILAAQERRG